MGVCLFVPPHLAQKTDDTKDVDADYNLLACCTQRLIECMYLFSKVHTVVSSSQERSGLSHSDSSLRCQQTFHQAVSASHYSFPEVAALASGSAAAAAPPSLYTYPASTALSSASQATEQLLGRGHSTHGHSPSAYAATYTSSSSRRDSASRKDSVSSLLHGLPAAYQHQFATGSPYVSVTPRTEVYSAYQLSPRRLAQYPYL